MGRLLVFTENYHVPAGAASYMVDLANSVADLYDDMVLASNPDGVAPDASSRILAPHTVEHVGLVTADRLCVDVQNATWMLWRGELASLLFRLATRFDRLVFAFNVAVCRRLVRRTRATAVLSFNGGYPAGRSVQSMVVAARREGVPVALCVTSVPIPRPDGRLREWETRMDARVAAAADVVIVNAHTIGAALEELRSLPGSKIKVVHNALPDVAARARRVGGEGPVRIGCVSRMDNMKGTRFLIAAFGELVRRFPDLRLVLVGDGPERESLERLVRDSGLGDHVTMTGHYDGDVAELISTFDVYAFPSLWEGLPYALLEAMRAGLAIVSTDVGGIPEAIEDGVTGLLVAPSSSQDLASAIARLLDDPDLRTRLGGAARERFEKEFSLAAMHAAAVCVFEEARLA